MNKKRLLSFILSAIMLFTIAFPTGVFAETTAPEITEQPENISAKAGESITLHVEARGDGLSYQWQYQSATGTKWTNASSAGAKTADWTFKMLASYEGRKYRCVITNSAGNSVTSDVATLSVETGPEITKQPENISAKAGEKITLRVTAQGDGLSYQWQYKAANSTKWTNASSAGAKKASWTFTMLASFDGRKYRCVITDSNGNRVTSNAATLSVESALTITEQPEDITAKAGEKITLHVEARGDGLSYQWQYKAATSTKWSNASSAGAKTADWTFKMLASYEGRKYRCIVSDSAGNSVTSDVATLSVESALEITEQPEDITAKAGEKITLRVAAQGTGLSYQWQYQSATGTKWTNASSAGAKTASWTFTMLASFDGRKYRCIVTDSAENTVTSDIATLTVETALEITEQPEDITAKAGENVTLHVAAQGDGLSYQWQYQAAGATEWRNASSAGAKTADWTFKMLASFDGRKYRCIVTDSTGNSVTSDVATLSVETETVLEITEQPEDITAKAGENVTLHVAAQGDGLSYQWQYQAAGATEWRNASSAGAKTADWTFKMLASFDGRKYQCIVTDSNGNSVTSDVATLTVEAALAITEQPEDIAAKAGEEITLHVAAQGDGLSYQWQYQAATSTKWSNASSAGAKTADWTFTMLASYEGRKYRCVITDSTGNSVTSDVATLTVETALEITEQPEDITAKAGEKITLHVAAQGDGLSYQWQYQEAGETEWSNASSAGAKTADWTFTMLASFDGRKYQCIITDSNGNSVTSDVATLTVGKALAITEQPEDITAADQDSVTFHVAAEGDGLSYQWQWKTDTATTWKNATSSGATSADWTVKVVASFDGRQYRCVVTDIYGDSIESDAVTLHISNEIIDGDFIFVPTADKSGYCLKAYTGTASDVVVPQTVKDLPVTEIGEEAFMDNKVLVSIDLPDTITVIRARAFKNCSKLSDMH